MAIVFYFLAAIKKSGQKTMEQKRTKKDIYDKIYG